MYMGLQLDYYLSGSSCSACRVASSCTNGKYLNGTCSHSTNPTCKACTNPLPSYNAGWTSEWRGVSATGCSWACGMLDLLPGEWVDTVCDACRVASSCSNGKYLNGTCSHSVNPTCDSCTNSIRLAMLDGRRMEGRVLRDVHGLAARPTT